MRYCLKNAPPFDRTVKVPSTSVYKDNVKFKCPQCKNTVGLEHFLPGYNETSSKHILTEKTTRTGFYHYSNMD